MPLVAPTNEMSPGDQAASLVDILGWRGRNQPGRIAYQFLTESETHPRSLTYGELDLRARQIADRISQSATVGDRALLIYPAGPDFISAFLGCMYAGIVTIPLFPPRPNRTLARLEGVIEDSGARLALTTRRTLADLSTQWNGHPQLAKVKCFTTDVEELSSAVTKQDWVAERDQLAFLQYTSGSTSTPKGVMVTHGNLIYNCAYMCEAFELAQESICVTWLPHFHDMGLIEGLLDPLFAGCPAVVLSPAQFVQRPLVWLETISRFRATHSGAPNFAYDLCARKAKSKELAELDLSSWSMAYCGAEPVRTETLDRFATQFATAGFRREFLYPCYGLAEATLMVCGGWKSAEPKVLDLDAAELERGRICPINGKPSKRRSVVGCGHARRDTHIIIADPVTAQRCPEGVVGEIWVSGPTLAAGYWQRPEDTHETFGARLAGSGAGPFLRTGDLGFLNADELHITGRLKDLIIIRGGNYYPQDLEWVAENAHPALRHGYGAAFSVDVAGEERLVVAQEVDRQYRKASVGELEEITAAIRQAVSSEYELDAFCVQLLNFGAIPKTSSGKIQRQACRADFLAGCLDVLWESRLTPADRTAPNEPECTLRIAELATLQPSEQRRALVSYLREKVAEVLSIAVRDVAPHKPLGSLGLDSLKGNELTVLLARDLQLELSNTLVWNYPTITDLAAHLAVGLGLGLDAARQQAVADRSLPAVAPDDQSLLDLVGEANRLSLRDLHQLLDARLAKSGEVR